MIKTAGGRFNPHEENVYFAAVNMDRMMPVLPIFKHLLLAVNEIRSPEAVEIFERVISDESKCFFLDSGVYNLAMSHARKHGVSHDEGLSISPEEIDGFNELYERYIEMARSYEKKLWGYVEIDQGGRENKIKTRAKLEALGLRPIPVYHPLSDGWDYFDYLAERYDRICFGNIVQADRATRIRLVATAWERHRKYPGLWIHYLGLTPNEWLNAYPANSGDSSAWIAPVRWPRFTIYADGCRFAEMDKEYYYELAGDRDASNGSNKAAALCGYQHSMTMYSWRQHMRDLVDIGCEVYP